MEVIIYTTAAAGADLPTARTIDDVDLIPYLINTNMVDKPHEHLFFCRGFGMSGGS